MLMIKKVFCVTSVNQPAVEPAGSTRARANRQKHSLGSTSTVWDPQAQSGVLQARLKTMSSAERRGLSIQNAAFCFGSNPARQRLVRLLRQLHANSSRSMVRAMSISAVLRGNLRLPDLATDNHGTQESACQRVPVAL